MDQGLESVSPLYWQTDSSPLDSGSPKTHFYHTIFTNAFCSLLHCLTISSILKHFTQLRVDFLEMFTLCGMIGLVRPHITQSFVSFWNGSHPPLASLPCKFYFPSIAFPSLLWLLHHFHFCILFKFNFYCMLETNLIYNVVLVSGVCKMIQVIHIFYIMLRNKLYHATLNLFSISIIRSFHIMLTWEYRILSYLSLYCFV